MNISIVIPVYNEKDNIPILAQELTDMIMQANEHKFEVIFIDDGSTDGSREAILNILPSFKKAIYMQFEKNAGQTDAFDAGFKKASGEVIITMDADLQNDPSDIPSILRYTEYYDVVCGIRKKRQDSWKKQLSSKIANTIRRKATGDEIKDIGCSLKAYRADYLKKIKLFKGMHRFFPILLGYEGATTVQIPVNHRPRKYGKAKYNITNRIFYSLIDLFAVCWMKKRKLTYNVVGTAERLPKIRGSVDL